MKIDFDVDIDMADRNKFLELVSVIPASIEKEGAYTKHNTGVYFQNIPHLPLEGYSTIDYKLAEAEGWFKVDFLNNSIYTDIEDETHLNRLLNTEPMWELLEHKEVVEQLFHINRYHNLTVKYKPKSIEQLAMLLAIIRPGKKHLVGKTWEQIAKSVWTKPTDGSYFFKKSHAIAYSTAIVVQLNLICEKLSTSFSN